MDTFGNIMTKKDIVDAKAALVQAALEVKKSDYDEVIEEDTEDLIDEIEEEKPKKKKVIPKKEKTEK